MPQPKLLPCPVLCGYTTIRCVYIVHWAWAKDIPYDKLCKRQILGFKQEPACVPVKQAVYTLFFFLNTFVMIRLVGLTGVSFLRKGNFLIALKQAG